MKLLSKFNGIMIINSSQGAKLTINAGVEIKFETISGIFVGYNEYVGFLDVPQANLPERGR